MMMEEDRESKLAAARKKLKNFQQKKSSSTTTAAATINNNVNSSTSKTSNKDDFRSTSPIIPSPESELVIPPATETNTLVPHHHHLLNRNDPQQPSLHSSDLAQNTETINILLDENRDLKQAQQELMAYIQQNLNQQVSPSWKPTTSSSSDSPFSSSLNSYNNGQHSQSSILPTAHHDHQQLQLQNYRDAEKMLAKMETEIERLQRQHESDRQEAQSQKLQLIEKLKVLVESNERLRRERDESPKSTPISASPSSTNHEIFSTTHSSSIEVEKLKEKIESLESMISEQNSQINSCRQQVEEATLNLQSEVEKNMVLAEEIEAMQSQNGAESDRLVYLEQKHQELITENQKLSQVAESSQVEAKDKNNQLAVLSERVDQLEKLRETWLVEINDKKSISDALSKTSDRLAKLQTENQTLLGHLEELRSRHVQIVDEKLQLAESLHYERRKSVMLDEEIKNLDTIPRSELDSIERLNAAKDSEIEGLKKQCLVLQESRDAIEERLILSETHLQKKLDAFEDSLQTNNTQMDRAISEAQASKREMNLIKAIWKKEQEKWKQIYKRFKILDQEALREASISQPPSPVRLSSPTTQELSQAFADRLEDSEEKLDSIILDEIQAMRDFQSQQQVAIERLEREKAEVFCLLEEERKLSTLLTAEVDSLPDYIFMYHQERKALINQMQRIVKKMRQEGTLQSKPRALPNEDEPLMSVLWENTEPKNIDNAVAVVETVTPGTKTLGSQVSAPIVTAEETSAYKTVSKVIVQGLVLQGHVYEFPPCKNCMIEDELIVL